MPVMGSRGSTMSGGTTVRLMPVGEGKRRWDGKCHALGRLLNSPRGCCGSSPKNSTELHSIL